MLHLQHNARVCHVCLFCVSLLDVSVWNLDLINNSNANNFVGKFFQNLDHYV